MALLVTVNQLSIDIQTPMKAIQAEVKVEELPHQDQQRLLNKERSIKQENVQSIIWAKDLHDYHRRQSDFLSNSSPLPSGVGIQMAERVMNGLLTHEESSIFMRKYQVYRQEDAYLFIILGFVKWRLDSSARYENDLQRQIDFYLRQSRKNENINFESTDRQMKDTLNICSEFLRGNPSWAALHLLNLKRQQDEDSIHDIKNLMRSLESYFLNNLDDIYLKQIMEEFSRLINGQIAKIKTQEELRQYRAKLEEQRRRQFMLRNPFLITKEDQQQYLFPRRQGGAYTKGTRGLV